MITIGRFSVLILALGLLALPLVVSADTEIQFGIEGDEVGGTLAGTSVTFPEAFSVAPTIVLTVDESADNNGAVSCRVISRSTTGFTFNCFIGGRLFNAFRVHWIAITDDDD